MGLGSHIASCLQGPAALASLVVAAVAAAWGKARDSRILTWTSVPTSLLWAPAPTFVNQPWGLGVGVGALS